LTLSCPLDLVLAAAQAGKYAGERFELERDADLRGDHLEGRAADAAGARDGSRKQPEDKECWINHNKIRQDSTMCISCISKL
jgi:hypothetical protein